MRDSYSLYETKAKLSAIIRQVREGRSVIVTVRGEPVAEIKPIAAADGGLESHLDRLAERGILVRPESRALPHPVVRHPGALARFLADRDG